jgi:glycosyl transferase family 25
MSGGAATAISKAAAQRLLDATNKFGRPVDTDIQHFWEKGIKVLSLMPYPIAQDMAFESTISAKKVTRKKYFWKRKWQQLHAAIVNRREVSKQVNKLKVALGL